MAWLYGPSKSITNDMQKWENDMARLKKVAVVAFSQTISSDGFIDDSEPNRSLEIYNFDFLSLKK